MSLFSDPAIENYLEQFAQLSDANPQLRAMEKFALETQFPIIGPQVGQLLYLLAKSIGAQRVFEFGSGFGYSAYWFAKACGAGGKIFCTECSPQNEVLAQKNFQRLGIAEKIDYRLGWAEELFAQTPGEFDIIFNDVNKEFYPRMFEVAASRVKSGGFYIADNTLWNGRVAQTIVNTDSKAVTTKAVQQHNEMVLAHPYFEAMLLPLRDGVLIARKK